MTGMRIGVLGLWHLGTVTAACLSEVHDLVVGVDEPDIVTMLSRGELPVAEPGLDSIISQSLSSGKLKLSFDIHELADVDVLVIAYDTPVDDHDRADVDFVWGRAQECLNALRDGTTVIVTSQVPVGFTTELAHQYNYAAKSEGRAGGARTLHFAYSPENLRLGRAIDCFKSPDRIVAGTESAVARQRIEALFQPFTDNFVWMSPASAEMTKHAINAYMGMSIAFINEIASICENVGADAREVEKGLKTDIRIGPNAPLSAGSAFAGGTLARDINFLVQFGQRHHCPTDLLSSISASNERHKQWAMNHLRRELDKFHGKTVAVLGLTYKPGTSTLRRSSSVELCIALAHAGAKVRVHDPSVRSFPEELHAVKNSIELVKSPEQIFEGAHALVLATPWPLYKSIVADDLSTMSQPLVLDANGFLKDELEDADIRYLVVGKA